MIAFRYLGASSLILNFDDETITKLINNLKSIIRDDYSFNSEFDASDFNLFKVDDEVIRHSASAFSLNISVLRASGDLSVGPLGAAKASVGPMDHQPGKHVDRSRDVQPNLAVSLWAWDRPQ